MTLALVSRLKPAHLKLIRSIHETGKLQLAADAANMSQPSASRLLSEIEADAGGALFDRLPRGMAATPLGEAFVRHARVILSELDALADEVASLRSGEAGELRVGAVTGPAVSVLVPALMALRQVAPDIRPTIEVAPSVDLVRGLEEGRFDFILARIGAASDTRAFHAYPGRTEDVALVVRSEHPLAGRRVPLAALLDYEFVIQEPGSPIRHALEQAFLEHRLPTPGRVTNSSSLLIALCLVSGSDAIAPQTREVAQMLTGPSVGLATVDIEERIVVPPYLVLHSSKRELTKIARRLLDEVLRCQ